MQSNCLLFAARLRFRYWLKCRRARRLGLKPPPMLYVVRRASYCRCNPFHVLLGRMTKAGTLRLVSYVPNVTEKRNIEILFAGHVKWGDSRGSDA